MVSPRKEREVEETFARCWWVSISRYSVLEVLTERQFTQSRTEDKVRRPAEESEAEKEI